MIYQKNHEGKSSNLHISTSKIFRFKKFQKIKLDKKDQLLIIFDKINFKFNKKNLKILKL